MVNILEMTVFVRKKVRIPSTERSASANCIWSVFYAMHTKDAHTHIHKDTRHKDKKNTNKKNHIE